MFYTSCWINASFSRNCICLRWGFHLLSKLIHNFRIFEGLSDDDLRESAYELLLAAMFFSGYFLSLCMSACVPVFTFLFWFGKCVLCCMRWMFDWFDLYLVPLFLSLAFSFLYNCFSLLELKHVQRRIERRTRVLNFCQGWKVRRIKCDHNLSL